MPAVIHDPKNRDSSQNRDELFKMTYLYYHLGDNDAKRYVAGDMPENQMQQIKSLVDRVFETRYRSINDRVQNFLEGKSLEAPRTRRAPSK